MKYVASALLMVLLAGCDDLADQPRFEPMEKSDFFTDGSSARQPVAGTVARGQLRTDQARFAGKVKGRLVDNNPLKTTRAALDRGRQQYDIYCAVCHGRTGDGDGMIVRRGFVRPPSFDIDRLRDAPDGHLFNVITHGYGAMFSYADRVETDDRWRIVAYIRALQLSQRVDVRELPPVDQDKLREVEP